jgi:hypothetical protein
MKQCRSTRSKASKLKRLYKSLSCIGICSSPFDDSSPLLGYSLVPGRSATVIGESSSELALACRIFSGTRSSHFEIITTEKSLFEFVIWVNHSPRILLGVSHKLLWVIIAQGFLLVCLSDPFGLVIVIEAKCLIFRWVEITSIWWEATLTIRLRRARLEAPMQLLNQLLMVTDLAGARLSWSQRSIPVRNRRTNKNLRWAILISLEGGVLNHRGQHVFVHLWCS